MAMAVCSLCKAEMPWIEIAGHRWKKHPEEAEAARMKGVLKAAMLKRKRKGNGKLPNEEKPNGGTDKPDLKGGKGTLNVSEAVSLKLLAQPYVGVLTPDITVGYMCALQRGFEGNLISWLSIASQDFWMGRGIDPFQEVSGIGYGERQAVGAGTGTEGLGDEKG